MPKTIPNNGDLNWGTTLNTHLSQITDPTNGGINISPLVSPVANDIGHTYVNGVEKKMYRYDGAAYQVVLETSNFVIFPTREDFINATIPAETLLAYWLDSNKRMYGVIRNEAASVPIEQVNGQKWTPEAEATPQHFGAKFDWDVTNQTGTDDYDAFDKMIKFSASERRKIFIPSGFYRVTKMVYITSFGQIFTGESLQYTQIIGDFFGTSEPVIRTKHSNCIYENFTIGASNNRKNNGLITDNGFEVQSNNTEAERTRGAECVFRQIRVRDQPGHGFLPFCSAYLVEQCSFFDNGGHGFVHDNGITLNRLPEASFSHGRARITMCRSVGNGGHAYAIGHPNIGAGITAYRIDFINNEGGLGTNNTSVMHVPEQYYIAGEQILISNCAGGGDNGVMFVAGRHIKVELCRFFSPTHLIRIGQITGYNTKDVTVEQIRTIGGDVPYAVLIDDILDINNYIRIKNSWNANITNLFDPADESKILEYVNGVNYKWNGNIL